MRAHRRNRPSTHTAKPTWHRDVRLLSISRGISMAGAEAGYIALLALAWELTGSASQASIVLLGSVIARTLSAPFAGWIGDHLDRRRVIVAGEVVVAASTASMAFAGSMVHLFAALMVCTFAASALGAALDASIASLVPEEDLPRANSMLGMARTTGHMLGPVLGGLAVAGFGARAAFLMDAASSLVAVMFVLGIRGSVGGAADLATGKHDGTQDRSVLAGLRVIAEDPVLRLLLVGWSGMCVCFAFVTAAELPLAVAFGVDEPGLGAIVTTWCAGSLFGSWMARRIDVEARGARVLLLNAVTCAVVFMATGIVPAFWCVLVLMAIGGFSMALAEVVETTIVQQQTEDHVRARVIAAFGGLFSAVWGTNLALAGLFVDAFSAQAAYVYGGVWCLVGAAGFAALGRNQGRIRQDEHVRSLVLRHALESELVEGA